MAELVLVRRLRAYMKLLQFVIAVLAVLCAASFASGLIHHVGWPVVAPLVASILLFVWFVLLRRRSLAAWYLGCVFFTIMLVQVVVFQALLPFLAQPRLYSVGGC